MTSKQVCSHRSIGCTRAHRCFVYLDCSSQSTSICRWIGRTANLTPERCCCACRSLTRHPKLLPYISNKDEYLKKKRSKKLVVPRWCHDQQHSYSLLGSTRSRLTKASAQTCAGGREMNSAMCDRIHVSAYLNTFRRGRGVTLSQGSLQHEHVQPPTELPPEAFEVPDFLEAVLLVQCHCVVAIGCGAPQRRAGLEDGGGGSKGREEEPSRTSVGNHLSETERCALLDQLSQQQRALPTAQHNITTLLF
jgi:hypothetical protein